MASSGHLIGYELSELPRPPGSLAHAGAQARARDDRGEQKGEDRGAARESARQDENDNIASMIKRFDSKPEYDM